MQRLVTGVSDCNFMDEVIKICSRMLQERSKLLKRNPIKNRAISGFTGQNRLRVDPLSL